MRGRIYFAYASKAPRFFSPGRISSLNSTQAIQKPLCRAKGLRVALQELKPHAKLRVE